MDLMGFTIIVFTGAGFWRWAREHGEAGWYQAGLSFGLSLMVLLGLAA